MAKSAGMQISRKGVFVWAGLIVFIAGWMFVLGIMVGRGMAPVNMELGKLEKELAELKAKMLRQEQAKVDAHVAGKGDAKKQLGFYEALKSPRQETDSFKPVPPVADKPKAPPEPKPRPASKPKPEPVAKPKPEPAAKPKHAPSPKPQSAAAVEKGRFTVQIASVQDGRNAQNLVDRLRKQGYRSYQIRTEVPGKGIWYRVRVGAFDNRGDADQMLARLKGDKYGGMVVSTR